MSKAPDILESIAVARYRKSARSPQELRQVFQNAVTTIRDCMMIDAQSESYVHMVDSVAENVRRHIDGRPPESFLGARTAKTAMEYVKTVRPSAIYAIEMLIQLSQYGYDLEARCIPWLVEKVGALMSAADIDQTQVELGFFECAGFLDAVFVGGMGCDRMLSPRPFRSKPSTHDITVNISKTRTQLSERLLESIRHATKEILIVGWLGRFIIPDLKRCVDRGVEVRVVTHRPQEAEGTIGSKDKSEAFSELKQFITADNVRLLPSCHARMVVIDERIAFVGSMDLDSQALGERDEAAVVSDDDEVMGRARQFFEELFARGTKPTW